MNEIPRSVLSGEQEIPTTTVPVITAIPAGKIRLGDGGQRPPRSQGPNTDQTSIGVTLEGTSFLHLRAHRLERIPNHEPLPTSRTVGNNTPFGKEAQVTRLSNGWSKIKRGNAGDIDDNHNHNRAFFPRPEGRKAPTPDSNIGIVAPVTITVTVATPAPAAVWTIVATEHQARGHRERMKTRLGIG